MLYSKRKRKKKFDGQEWRSILPYKCIKCKISFLEENSLKEHIESFHNVVYEGQEIPDKKKNKKIHKCPDCDIRCEIFVFSPLIPSKREKNILVLLS